MIKDLNKTDLAKYYADLKEKYEQYKNIVKEVDREEYEMAMYRKKYAFVDEEEIIIE